MAIPDELSKTQIDRLGDRLRTADISEADLRLLDSYRRSFTAVYQSIVGQIRDQLGLKPTGRPAKSTTSISEKLRRESIRFSQMQDIAGCRVIVENTLTQDEVVTQLKGLVPKWAVIDRREHPSHGYRAVHFVADYSGKLIEIQIRTSFQHLWAELSEKASDIVDPAIKYGGGDDETRSVLMLASKSIETLEEAEHIFLQGLRTIGLEKGSPDEMDPDILQTQERIRDLRESLPTLLDRVGELIPKMKGRKNDISD